MNEGDRRRFWKKVRVSRRTGCWNWTGALRTWNREPWDGKYGAFWMNGRVHRAHKVAYRIMFGEVPEGKVLLHSCDNRRCVNVLRHVRPGTQLQNVLDMVRKGRQRNGFSKKH